MSLYLFALVCLATSASQRSKNELRPRAEDHVPLASDRPCDLFDHLVPDSSSHQFESKSEYEATYKA